MTFLSVLIALILERATPQLIELRQFRWLDDYIQWMLEALHIERLGKWGAIIALFSPLLLLTWGLDGLFENSFFGLFEIAFNVAVLFFCLGPKSLDAQVDRYLDALEIGDSRQQYEVAHEFIAPAQAPASDLHDQVSQFCKSMFVEANSRVYAVLFWFVLLGPVAAVFYRVLEQLLSQKLLQAPLERLNMALRVALGWVDWIPARISLFAFMISGSFDEGLQAMRNSGVYASDSYEHNHDCLSNVGYQSMAAQQVVNPTQAIEMVRKSRGLVLRSLVVWLLLLFVIVLLV